MGKKLESTNLKAFKYYEIPGVSDDPGDDLNLLVLHTPGRDLVVPGSAVRVIVSASTQKAANLNKFKLCLTYA